MSRFLSCRHHKSLIAAIFLISSAAFSQEPSFRYYSANDGLSGGRVLDILQDRKGYLWSVTPTGISRFDGARFKNYTVESEYTITNGAFRMHEDKQGRIWFIRFNGKLCYHQNDSFYIPYFIRGIEKENVCWVSENDQGTLVFGTRDGQLIIYSSAGLTSRIKIGNNPAYTICALNDSIFLYSFENQVFTLNVNTSRTRMLINAYVNHYGAQKYLRFNATPQKTILVTLSSGIMEIDQKLNTRLFFTYDKVLVQPEVFNIYCENDSVTWIPSRKGVSRVVHKKGKIITAEKFLSEVPVFAIKKDRRDNIWFSTSFGLTRMTSLAVRYVTGKAGKEGGLDSRLKYIVSPKAGQLFLFTEMGMAYLFENGGAKFVRNFNDYFTYKVTASRDTVFVVGSLGAVQFSPAGVVPVRDLFFSRSKSPSGEVYDVRFGTVLNVGNGARQRTIAMPFSISVEQMAVFNDSDIWMGSYSGLYHYNGKTLDYAPKTGSFPPDNVTGLRIDRFGNLWIATNGYGVFLYRNGKSIQLKVGADQITDNFCNSIYIDDQDQVWLCNNEGLNRITLDNQGRIKKIFRFTRENAFVTGEVFDVAVEGPKVYAATNNGLAIIDLRSFEDKLGDVPLLLNALYINNKLSDMNQHQFAYDQNAVEFDFSMLNLGPGDISYKYRLLPLSTQWISSKHNRARFEALAPGNYTFEVSGMIGTKNAAKLASYSFSIHPPWWSRAVFYIPVTLIAFFLILLFLRLRLNQAKRKIEVQRNLLESELKVLRLQMNPHFLFNTLQSIQDFVIRKQGSEAIHYLSKFSKLVRMILNYSKRSSITLQEELGFIDNYVELEQMRNPGEFTFNKKISPDLKPDELHIPPMILQPFIENTFKHALGRGRGDQLCLTVQDEGKSIRVIIEDNGNGINSSARKKDHESSGIAITTERIQRLSGLRREFDPVRIEDLSETTGATGTRISIYLKKEEI